MWRCVLGLSLLNLAPYVNPAVKGQRVLSSPDIPVTQFTCSGKPPGYYADVDTGCQVYHMCTDGANQFSYRCPNTTLFQQRMLICAHWYQVNCSRSEQHYGANLLIGQRDKPFVNDEHTEKQIKTLQNPDVLQHLGEGTTRQPKAHVSSFHVNSLNGGGEFSIKFSGKTSSTPPSTDPTISNTRANEKPTSLPLAGSVLPGGVKSFHFPRTPEQSFSFSNQFKQNFPSTTRIPLVRNVESLKKTLTQGIKFDSSTQATVTANWIFTTKLPIALTEQSHQSNVFKSKNTEDSLSLEANLNVKLPLKNGQANDLVVASQENALFNNKFSTEFSNFSVGVNLFDTSVKAEIEQTKNGSFPDDKYNTFINRFNPYNSEGELKPAPMNNEEPPLQLHAFINRFNPYDGQSADNLLKNQPEEHLFTNRFILTPKEENIGKENFQVAQLHNILPPNDEIYINSPSNLFTPPRENAKSNSSDNIEIHFQDPRQRFFIPNGGANDASKDAAPIVVTIPLKTHKKSSQMWFRTSYLKDVCSRCHPSFVINKANCTPCVVIR